MTDLAKRDPAVAFIFDSLRGQLSATLKALVMFAETRGETEARLWKACDDAEATVASILIPVEATVAPVVAMTQDARPLSDDAIKAGWHSTFSTSNPFCPCDLTSFTKAVRWAEAQVASQRAPLVLPPDGWKLVPVEPSRAMLKATDDMTDDKWLSRGRAYDMWDRMLRAAPLASGERDVHPAQTPAGPSSSATPSDLA